MPSIADQINGWQQMLAAADANGGDLQILEPQRLQLAAIVSDVVELSTQQKAGRADRQQATQARGISMAKGKKMARRLRDGIRSVYGASNMKLVEFGIKPLKEDRHRKAETEAETGPEPPSAPTPPETPVTE